MPIFDSFSRAPVIGSNYSNICFLSLIAVEVVFMIDPWALVIFRFIIALWEPLIRDIPGYDRLLPIWYLELIVPDEVGAFIRL